MLITICDTIHGDTMTLTLDQVIEEINRDRSDLWTPYDASDWREGLEEFTDYIVLKVDTTGQL